MTYLLPPANEDETQPLRLGASDAAVAEREVLDLKDLWGPEFYRIEYLIHLLDTGRVKDVS